VCLAGTDDTEEGIGGEEFTMRVTIVRVGGNQDQEERRSLASLWDNFWMTMPIWTRT
jgi:hypothetical protein